GCALRPRTLCQNLASRLMIAQIRAEHRVSAIMTPLSNFAMRDVETILHPATNLAKHRTTGPLVVDRAEGIYVWDAEGKRYIEGLAGLWCTALGYGNQELVEAAREQMSKLSFTHLFGGRSHEPAIALAEKLKELVPTPT